MSVLLEKPAIDEFGLSRFVLRFGPFIEMSDEQFFEFCQANRAVRIERNSKGEVIVIPPAGRETGSRNKDKMREYIENGVSRGWLTDSFERKVYVYRPGAEVEALENPAEISGDPVLPGFGLNLKEIWD